MSYKTSEANIPTFGSAEELLAWLIQEFEAVRTAHGLVILTGDDLADLIIAYEQFRDNTYQD